MTQTKLGRKYYCVFTFGEFFLFCYLQTNINNYFGKEKKRQKKPQRLFNREVKFRGALDKSDVRLGQCNVCVCVG